MGGAPLIRIEPIPLIDASPGQFLPPTGQFVAAACQLLLRFEQIKACCQALLTVSQSYVSS